MLAREVMTSPVVTVGPDATLKDAIQLLDRHDITALPVVDDEECLVGLVSEADLLRGEVMEDPRAHVRPVDDWPEQPATSVSDVMTTNVITTTETADASDISRIMLDSGVKSIPVVHGPKVVGIVSRRDLIRALARTDDEIEEEIQSLLADARLEGWTVSVSEGVAELVGHGSDQEIRIAGVLARTVAGVSGVHLPDDPERRR
ncbi:MAG: CBS domain-containing protein [Jiangellaceae bacterium]